MNPFEEFITQTNENEMTRSQSFDFSNVRSSPCEQHTQIPSVSSAIGYDPARMAEFLGCRTLQNKPSQKLETIYENLSISKQNFSPSQTPSNIRPNQTQSSDKTNTSVRGSVSSWQL